eukprot:TRINITY_DN70104_c0_g1_i1.p1 TRINITY_DN70104_c0_g1~~TRINITY_DN70104_c0_g1_i1.p1  ORF type:complete len:234 (+),score=7.64 TRINITY_DN70104_c0_g1_i1:26-727(+)
MGSFQRDYLFQDNLEELNPETTTAESLSQAFTRKCLVVKLILAYADGDPTLKSRLSEQDAYGVSETFLQKIKEEGFEAFKDRVSASDIVRKRTGKTDAQRRAQHQHRGGGGGYGRGGHGGHGVSPYAAAPPGGYGYPTPGVPGVPATAGYGYPGGWPQPAGGYGYGSQWNGGAAAAPGTAWPPAGYEQAPYGAAATGTATETETAGASAPGPQRSQYGAGSDWTGSARYRPYW